MADNSGRYTSTYDGRGMVQAVTSPPDKQIQYSYDELGRRSQMVDPDGGRFTYSYDQAGRLDHLVNANDERTTWTYDALGRATEKLLANGYTTSYIYDAAGQLSRVAHSMSTGWLASSYDYTYDKAGNRSHVLEKDGTRVTWTYDKTYQLSREGRSGLSDITHQYDAVGNRLANVYDDRTTMGSDDERTTYTYDAANQLSTSEDSRGTTNYTYDEAGNLKASVHPLGVRTTNTWDGMNRRTLSQYGFRRATMVYNADGLRVRKEWSRVIVNNFIWDGQNYLAETDDNDATQLVYTHEPAGYGKLISQRRLSGGSWTSDYLHFDGLGSTINITDAVEAIQQTYIYDAFGNRLSGYPYTTPFLWIGQLGYYYDLDPNDYYIRARHYDPTTARWLSQDPLEFDAGDMNLYRYVHNNPTRFTDPSGTWYWTRTTLAACFCWVPFCGAAVGAGEVQCSGTPRPGVSRSTLNRTLILAAEFCCMEGCNIYRQGGAMWRQTSKLSIACGSPFAPYPPT